MYCLRSCVKRQPRTNMICCRRMQTVMMRTCSRSTAATWPCLAKFQVPRRKAGRRSQSHVQRSEDQLSNLKAQLPQTMMFSVALQGQCIRWYQLEHSMQTKLPQICQLQKTSCCRMTSTTPRWAKGKLRCDVSRNMFCGVVMDGRSSNSAGLFYCPTYRVACTA